MTEQPGHGLDAVDNSDGRTTRARALRAERRAHILDAAVSVFSERGYHGTSVSDVIAAAGIARGTFYLYFGSKKAIFLELLDQLLVRFRAGVVGVEPSDGNVFEQLVVSIAGILRTAVDNQAIASIILREAVGLDAEVDQRMRSFYDSLHAYLVQSLTYGTQMGIIRELVDTDVAATCILGSIRQVLDRHLIRGGERQLDDDNLEHMARAILDFNACGVLNLG